MSIIGNKIKKELQPVIESEISKHFTIIINQQKENSLKMDKAIKNLQIETRKWVKEEVKDHIDLIRLELFAKNGK